MYTRTCAHDAIPVAVGRTFVIRAIEQQGQQQQQQQGRAVDSPQQHHQPFILTTGSRRGPTN